MPAHWSDPALHTLLQPVAHWPALQVCPLAQLCGAFQSAQPVPCAAQRRVALPKHSLVPDTHASVHVCPPLPLLPPLPALPPLADAPPVPALASGPPAPPFAPL